jgi:periplasmic divalent cation tolerance protein
VNEQFVIAISTFPDVETARKISRELVDSALVACANIIPALESIYYWKEKVETSAESLAIFKLTAARYSEFESRLRNLHPYDVPEIVRLNIAGGSADYLRWIGENCSRQSSRAQPRDPAAKA